MPDSPNKLSQFWQELKRRKVVRVITVYAAAAFVILELVDIITEPFGLPSWTLKLVVVLLSIGLIVSVILSWIYDLHPEGGVVKTEPGQKIKPEKEHAGSNSWKIASYISFMVIVALIVLNIIPRSSRSNTIEILDRSIAVLPFTYLSDEPDKQYLADGTMDEILLNLSKIEDLRVLARTSVEQYRETDKTATEICKELNVAYLLEGSFLKNGDQVRLIVQLIQPGREGHAWAKRYDRSWHDIFMVQSEVAQLIATELQAVITPNEKHLIDKIPTASISAYDLYLKATDYRKAFIKNRDLSSYETAVNLYEAALEIDSTFAKAYTGLAYAYYRRYQYENYLKEDYLDSSLILIDMALSFDDELDEAYYLKGLFCRLYGDFEEALANYDKALKLNPNYYRAYISKGYIYTMVRKDFVKGIETYEHALDLIQGDDRQSILNRLIRAYIDVGIIDKAKSYLDELLILSSDSLVYLDWTAWIEFSLENFENALRLIRKQLAFDTTLVIPMDYYNCLPETYKEEAYLNAKDNLEWIEKRGSLALQYAHRIGYAFYMVGKQEEANYYFDQQIKYGEESIKLERSIAKSKVAQYDLAATYTFLGEKQIAYDYLDELTQMNTFPLWWLALIKNDPLFKSIRGEPEFQQIVQELEKKFQAEHERVRQWLEENDML